MVGWVGGGRVLVGDVWHAGMFQREDEINGCFYGVDLSMKRVLGVHGCWWWAVA